MSLKKKQKSDKSLNMFLDFQNKSGQQHFLVDAAGVCVCVCVCVYLSGAAVRAGVSPAGVMCK